MSYSFELGVEALIEISAMILKKRGDKMREIKIMKFVVFTILSAVMLVHGDTNVSQWDKEEKMNYEKLLEQKPNNVLKNSLLEELYLRDMVTLENDTLKFKLHFDLHS